MADARRLTPRAAREPMVPGALPRSAERTQETADTWTLELEPEQDGRRCPFAPGQFTMLYAFGVGEVPDLDQRRPRRGRARWSTPIRAVGAVTAGALRAPSRASAGRARPVRHALAASRTAEGQRRASSSPAGSAWRRCGRSSTSCWRTASASAAWSLLYGGRDAGRLLYRDELDALARAGSTSRSR